MRWLLFLTWLALPLQAWGADVLPSSNQAGFHSFIADPDLIYVLLLLGLIGLYLELANPGMVLPGVVGVILLILALFALQTVPVHYGSLGLMLLGISLLLTEAFVPSFGLLGLAGLSTFLFGSLSLVDTSQGNPGINPWLVYTSTGVLAVISIGAGRLLVKSQKLKPLNIQDNMVGAQAKVTKAITPPKTGEIQVFGELWEARASQPVELGQSVRITALQGMVAVVEPV
ncbi:MAG: hypothetical protein OEV94_06790 [Deltaproteobacteria bacterium]|nr:hypothetical protein [Deltaproteobacteria bacterium]